MSPVGRERGCSSETMWPWPSEETGWRHPARWGVLGETSSTPSVEEGFEARSLSPFKPLQIRRAPFLNSPPGQMPGDSITGAQSPSVTTLPALGEVSRICWVLLPPGLHVTPESLIPEVG